MSRMLTIRCLHALALVTLVQNFCPGLLSKVAARDLTDVVRSGFSLFPADITTTTSIIGTINTDLEFADTSAAGKAFAPALSAAVAQAVTQQSPLASIAPAFTYRYNPTLGVFERSTGVPGPLFSERALALGKGQLNFGIGYSFIDLDEFNGTDLDNIRSPLMLEVFCPSGGPLFSDPLCNQTLPDGTSLLVAGVGLASVRTRIDLQAHLTVPTVRYGITDNWDIGLSIPIVNTFLRVRNEVVPVVATTDTFFVGAFDSAGEPILVGFLDKNLNPRSPFTARYFAVKRASATLSKASGSATGVGDISLRTKYHLWRTEAGGAAIGLNLHLPSGEEKDFHGTGETHLSPFVYLSQVFWDRFEPHLNLGVDFNADDVDRSSFLYAVGGTFLVGTRLGLIVDFIGRNEFGRFPPVKGTGLLGLVLERPQDTCTPENPCTLKNDQPIFRFPAKLKRNDVIDFSFGLRYALGTSGSVFFGGIVPLNDDGFRADFIPSGGIEYTF